MADCLKKLLGLCCGCQGCPGQTWAEVRVLSVQNRVAYTTVGPVRLNPGNHPRPGGKLLVTQEQGALRCHTEQPPRAAGQTPQRRMTPRPSVPDVIAPPPPERPPRLAILDCAGPGATPYEDIPNPNWSRDLCLLRQPHIPLLPDGPGWVRPLSPERQGVRPAASTPPSLTLKPLTGEFPALPLAHLALDPTVAPYAAGVKNGVPYVSIPDFPGWRRNGVMLSDDPALPVRGERYMGLGDIHRTYADGYRQASAFRDTWLRLREQGKTKADGSGIISYHVYHHMSEVQVEVTPQRYYLDGRVEPEGRTLPGEEFRQQPSVDAAGFFANGAGGGIGAAIRDPALVQQPVAYLGLPEILALQRPDGSSLDSGIPIPMRDIFLRLPAWHATKDRLMELEELVRGRVIYEGELGTLPAPGSGVTATWCGIQVDGSRLFTADAIGGGGSVTAFVLYEDGTLVRGRGAVKEGAFVPAGEPAVIPLDKWLPEGWALPARPDAVPIVAYPFLAPEWPHPTGELAWSNGQRLLLDKAGRPWAMYGDEGRGMVAIDPKPETSIPDPFYLSAYSGVGLVSAGSVERWGKGQLKEGLYTFKELWSGAYLEELWVETAKDAPEVPEGWTIISAARSGTRGLYRIRPPEGTKTLSVKLTGAIKRAFGLQGDDLKLKE